MSAGAGAVGWQARARGGSAPWRSPARWWTVVAAFVRRDGAITVSYRLPFVLGVVQSTLSLGFLYFLSRLVGPQISRVATHGSYFDFAVVGTTLLLLFSSTLVSMAQRLRTDQSTGTLEVLFTMPFRSVLVVFASAAYQVVYSTAVAVVVLLVAVGLGLRFDVSPASALTAVGGLVGAVAFFVSMGVALAAYVLVFKRGETLTGLAVSGLSVVGGVYYPVSFLPHGLRVLANVLPFTWVVTIVRGSLLEAQVPLGRLGQLAASDLVALPVALALFSAALRHSKRKGTLGQY